MALLAILVCFSALLQASLSTPDLASKPEPVDLSFTCTTVIVANQQEVEPDDVPVILLHGMGGNKHSWDGVFEIISLETKKKVCAVDLRNHGDSPWNDKEYDVIAMTEDIRHMMDQIKADKAIIIGHSLGGRISVHLALSYPERVEKVIVEDIRPSGIPPADTLAIIQVFSRMYTELEKDIPQGLSEKEAKEKFLQIMKEYLVKVNVTYEMNDLSYVPLKCSNGKCRLSTNPVLWAALLRNMTELMNESTGQFNGPALFIYGGASSVKVGEDESNIRKLFPNAELVEVEGADHTVHNTKKFQTEVIKFINKKKECNSY